MIAKIADFGVSKLAPVGGPKTTKCLKGTIGYMDPLYQQTSRYTAASDVYSFGLVLLQVVCGAKDVQVAKQVATSMVDEKASVDDAVQLLLDQHVPEDTPRHALLDLIHLGAACVCMKAACRPRMGCTAADRDSVVGRLAWI